MVPSTVGNDLYLTGFKHQERRVGFHPQSDSRFHFFQRRWSLIDQHLFCYGEENLVTNITCLNPPPPTPPKKKSLITLTVCSVQFFKFRKTFHCSRTSYSGLLNNGFLLTSYSIHSTLRSAVQNTNSRKYANVILN